MAYHLITIMEFAWQVYRMWTAEQVTSLHAWGICHHICRPIVAFLYNSH